MRSAWNEREAHETALRYGDCGVSSDLALRLYSTRLIGREPRLVLHGGGNTSLKAAARDLAGEEVEVLHVKASGADMAAVEPKDFPAVRLQPLRRLRAREGLSDAEMARVQRAFLLDPLAPSPSVEMLLHAFLPARFIDHSHPSALLSLVDQPHSRALCEEVFGDGMGFVPYRMPGFALAQLAAGIFEENPRVEGLILDKHGLFTFGDSAREAYERMIAAVTRAEARLQRNRKTFAAAALPGPIASARDIAPILRGAATLRDADGEGAHRRPILAFRSSDTILNFLNRRDLARTARAGVVTPDHVVRVKPWPLVLPAPQAGGLAEFRTAVHAAVQAFADDYTAYFARHAARAAGAVMHDPMPRVALVPGVGLFGLGPHAQAANIAADLAAAAIGIIADAEAIGTFRAITEADMFDCEYWPLEIAKLGRQGRRPLAGQVAVITGAGGAIGSATARVFAEAGAEVALLDIDEKAAREKAAAIGGAALPVACDVTDAASVRSAFAQVVAAFGGVDIVVSNAGAAWQGRIGEVDEATLRQSFELNFFAHQKVAQAAVGIMLAQGIGGCLLFNVSKQAVNPGPDFGPYGLPKAATLFLARQYALDYGADGIRANAVNADRVRSGLLTDAFIKARAAARGVTEKDYMSGNLLRREVTAEDVAQAFLAQALALKTTAGVTTVDGGNIAAALR